MAIEIISPKSETEWADCRYLHREYVNYATAHPILGQYFITQNFSSEVDQMPVGYLPPEGICLVAYKDGIAAGTVALRKFDSESCEMKRLYVRPAMRSGGIARLLIERALTEARHLGYSKMKLDNSKSAMEQANNLYKAMGVLRNSTIQLKFGRRRILHGESTDVTSRWNFWDGCPIFIDPYVSSWSSRKTSWMYFTPRTSFKEIARLITSTAMVAVARPVCPP